MPLPTGTARRGSGLTRSEAAILAWKKRPRKAKPGALDPKIAARVKQILAGKQKKGKAAPKAKAAPKGTPQERANQNRASVAKQGGMDKLEGVIVRLNAGMNSDLEKDAHKELISKGLATRGADGKAKLTPAGKKWKAAADKGDTEKAGAALAEGAAGASERTAKDTIANEKSAARATAKAERVAKQQAKAAARQAKMKQAAGKVKAKAGAAKKPPAAAKPDAAANRAKVAKEMSGQGGLDAAGSAALGGFADGKPLGKDTAAQFEAMGLVEKDSEGGTRLSSEGRAAAAAMSKGDTRAALDAISRAKDKKKQGSDKAKAKSASDKAKAAAGAAKQKATADAKSKKDASAAAREAALIEAARNRKALDMDELFSIDDLLAIKAGARHSRTDSQHLQSIHDSSVACGASCGPESDDGGGSEPEDDEAATTAIKGIMDNPAWYAQHECGDMMQACSALQTLGMLMQSELGEEDDDPGDVAQLCDAADILIEFIQSELDELRGAAKEAAGTVGHAPFKGIEIERLEDGEEIAVVDGYAVKSLSEPGMVGGYLVKFGGDGDLSQWRDVFTKQTNFGKHTKTDVWVHHRMLPGLGKQQLTNQAELGMDDEGVFVKHLLDLRKSYEAKLYSMAQAGKLGWSSGTAPHLVDRKALGDGRHEITQWTLGLDASYTPTPAGGLEVNTSALKTAFLAELGLDAIDNDSPEAIKTESARPDGVEADNARARRLTLELDLLALEETAL